MPQPQTLPIPETVILDGRLAVELKEYILSQPTTLPARVVVGLVGALEMALQQSAQKQAGANGAGSDEILAAARKLIQEQP